MPKFTVKITTTTVIEADTKEEVTAEALRAVEHMSPLPEIVVTKYRVPKKIADTKTVPLFGAE
ncbi:MAG: hypothetical protein A2104_00855 [Candidatus Melainabacteria bacterium GWF2_32_7]|nr:MAG: hypothetical protein A2104_00855 [Candidatus Melainabacteria bacterium GWF2_32_7]